MKVVLRADMPDLGKRGDIVDVADGHARNYLLPRGLALTASAGSVAQAAKMRASRDERDAQARERATGIASKLVPTIIAVSAKAGPEGRLFGSVTAADLAAAIEAQTGIVIDRHAISVDTVKTVGEHSATVSLHAEVSFPVRFEVSAAS